MLWGRRRGDGTIVVGSVMELPHVKPSRLEPMPRPFGSGSYDYRGDRDELIELAGGGGGAGDRASSAQETRSRPGCPSPTPPPLASGGPPSPPRDPAHC